MSLETASTIAQLQSSAPSASDPVNQGDDHIRMVKAVLKNMFPGVGGQGFSVPIVATEAEINFLDGVTSNIQTQLNSLLGQLSAPTGTRMPFFQAAPPAGWSLVTTYDDYMLRVVNSTGGGAGGSDSPILNNKVPSHTHAANSVVTDPGHFHTLGLISNLSGTPSGGATQGGGATNTTTNTTGITVATTVSANAGASNWTPKYLDMVIGQKS